MITLSPSDRRIVDLLSQGYDIREIATDLKRSRSTVKLHLSSLFRRFDINDGVKHVKLAMMSCRNSPISASKIPKQNCILTPREWQVVALVADGMKSKDIGAELGVTEHVVKNYLRHIFDKTGMWTRLEVALWYESRHRKEAA